MIGPMPWFFEPEYEEYFDGDYTGEGWRLKPNAPERMKLALVEWVKKMADMEARLDGEA